VKSTVHERAKELRKVWGGFRPARVLITANNYRVFDHLLHPRSARAVSENLNTDLRGTEILLDALVAIGLLVKQKNRYRNTAAASQFLVSGKRYYQGDIIRHADALWENWSGLDAVLRSGKPGHRVRDWQAFILGMHNIASLKVRDVIDMIGLNGVRTALDLGGGPGTYSIEMARRGIKVTLFDLSETIEIAKKVIGKEKADGIILMGGDFMADDIGKGYDLVFISQILHSYSEKDNLRLLKKCKKALNKCGRMVIQEFYIDRARTHPVQGALFSVNMLVNTEGGRCYSTEEIRSWILKTGLKKIRKGFIDDSVIVVGQ
jgi:2-polyprenyl-3-methyl-5-hydroxy-6-metoxy-1,4-benzoquinol methylase